MGEEHAGSLAGRSRYGRLHSMPRLLPTICGTALSGRRHVCAFFSDPVAAYPVMGPYVREGITRHERVLACTAANNQNSHIFNKLKEAARPGPGCAKTGYFR